MRVDDLGVLRVGLDAGVPKAVLVQALKAADLDVLVVDQLAPVLPVTRGRPQLV